ncbi:MAG: GH25 family lysozyme [Pseudomonadota bacterium]
MSETVNGIDASHYQSSVDWGEVAGDGIDFVSIKATQGSTPYSYSSYYTDNIQPARSAGLIAGGFHFFTGGESGKDQANQFLSVANPQRGDLLPMLDLEQTNGAGGSEIAQEALSWLQTVEAAVGGKPFLYTTASFFSQIGNPTGFEDYPLWVAEYGVTSPNLPQGWTEYTIWQHSESGSVTGISGAVDLDLFNGSKSHLKRFRV